MENINIPSQLQIKAHWNKFQGKLKQRFGELTEDDLTYLEGKQDELVSFLQKKLDRKQDDVLHEVRELVEELEGELKPEIK